MTDAEQQARAWAAEYSAPQVRLAELLCDRHPAEAVALTEVEEDLRTRDLTYGRLAEQSAALATGLAELGVAAGDRVATLMGKGADLLIAALAIWRLGAVHVPLFTAFAPSAVALRLTDSATKAVITDPAQRPKLDPGPDMGQHPPWHIVVTATQNASPGDATLEQLLQRPASPAAAMGGDAPFILLYTSSTTGTPKGVEVPVRALASFRTYLTYGLDVRADDVFWNAADPGWAYGLYYGVVAPLLVGQRTIMLRAGFDAELTLEVLTSLGVSNFTAAPTVYRALRAALRTVPPDLALRRLSSAGEPLGAEAAGWARDAFGVEVRDHYGQTELGMCAGNHNHPDVAGELRPGSLGTPLPGWTVTVLDPLAEEVAAPGEPGRVAVDTAASPCMWFTGYRGQARYGARFSPDGRWYLTGDTGSRDDDGYLFFTSRDNDVIVTAGYRIGPFDVESALLEHPQVAETAVYGLPDELRGEVVAASVVLAEGAVPTDELAGELKELVKRRFASHAYPRVITFVDALPKAPSGKLQRVRLRQGRA